MVHFNADEKTDNKKLPGLDILTKNNTFIDPRNDEKVVFEHGDIELFFKGDFEYVYNESGTKVKKGKIKKIHVDDDGQPDWQLKGLHLNAKKFFKKVDDGKLDNIIKNKIFDGGDKIWGSNFDDKLFGFDGKDRINGWRGDDKINGGKNKDKLTGFSGDDTFVFDTKLGKNNVDKITDFSRKHDSFELDQDIFSGFAEGKLHKDAFAKGHADADDPQIVYKKDKGKVYYDPDGTGEAKDILFAKVDKHQTLTHDDFFVI